MSVNCVHDLSELFEPSKYTKNLPPIAERYTSNPRGLRSLQSSVVSKTLKSSRWRRVYNVLKLQAATRTIHHFTSKVTTTPLITHTHLSSHLENGCTTQPILIEYFNALYYIETLSHPLSQSEPSILMLYIPLTVLIQRNTMS